MANETKISGSDWEKLDRKFGGLHNRINEMGQDMTEKINRAREDATAKVNASHNELAGRIGQVDTKVEVLKNAPTVLGHEKIYHATPREKAAGDMKKFWGIVIAVVTGVSAGIGFLLALIKEMVFG